MAQIARKWIEDGAVDNTKIDSTASYTVGGMSVTGGATVGTTLGVSGRTTTQDLQVNRDSTFTGHTVFNGIVTGIDNSVVEDLFVGGRIGVGTNNPVATIHTLGDIVGNAAGTSNLGSDLNRWATVYMASNIDVKSGSTLIFKHDTTSNIVIDSTGNLGIGTTNPQFPLHVNATSARVHNMVDTGDVALSLRAGSLGKARLVLQPANNSAMAMGISAHDSTHRLDIVDEAQAIRMTITNGGLVGIGTENPLSIFNVNVTSNANMIKTTVNGSDRFNVTATAAGATVGILKADGVTNDVVLRSGGDSYFVGGKVGIGSASPSSALTINSDPATAGALTIMSATTLPSVWHIGAGIASTDGFNIREAGGVNSLFCIEKTTGFIGIGTTNPGLFSGVAANDSVLTLTPKATGFQSYLELCGNVAGSGGSGGALNFLNLNNTSAANLVHAQITAATTGSTANNRGADIYFGTKPDGGALATQAVITGAGRLGIGTMNPQGVFQVFASTGSANSYVTAATTGAAYSYWNNASESLLIGTENSTGNALITGSAPYDGVMTTGGAYKLCFGTQNIARMVIASDGKVGIGTTDPIFPLTLSASAGMGFRYSNASTSSSIILPMGDAGGLRLKTDSGVTGSTPAIAFQTYSAGYADRMVITGSGIVGIGTTAPAGHTLMLWKASDGAGFDFYRVGTAGGDVASGDDLGAVYWAGRGQSLMRNAGYLNMVAAAAPLNDSVPGHMVFATTPVGTSQSPVERMRITSAGNVGIGTTNPGNKTDIRCASGDGLFVGTTSYGTEVYAFMSPNQTGEYFSIQANKGGGGARPLVLNSAGGNVGLGTTNPYMSLQIKNLGGLDTQGPSETVWKNMCYYSGGSDYWFNSTYKASELIQLNGEFRFVSSNDAPTANSIVTNFSAKMTITAPGTVGIGTTNPDSALSVYAPSTLGIFSGYRPASTPTNTLMYLNSDFGTAGNTVFKITVNGQIYSDAGTTISSPADFAEWTKVTGDVEEYEVGDIVMQDPDEDMLVSPASDTDTIYGIITDRATFCGGLTEAFEDIEIKKDFMALPVEELEEKYNAKRVAMTGHVVCKVLGTVVRGQRLCLSDEPGVAKAATTFEEKALSFAIARENYDEDEIGLIEVRLM